MGTAARNRATLAALAIAAGFAAGRGRAIAQIDPAQRAESAQRALADVTGETFLLAIAAGVAAYLAIAAVRQATNWISERVPRRFRLLVKQSSPFWKGIILIATAVYWIDLFFNFSEANLIALTGTLAVALGFAFKDYVSSIVAGIVALFEAPYRMGDRVKIGEVYGEVVGYGLRGIQIQTPDDNTVTVPHSKTWTEAISNANSGKLEAQTVADFYFDRAAEVDRVTRILYQAAYSSKYTQLKHPVVVIVEEKLWGTHFRLKSYPMDARDEFVYKTDLVRRAKQAFARERLPYPKLPLYSDDRLESGESN